MERSTGIIGMAAVAVIAMLCALNSRGGAVETSAQQTLSGRMASWAGAEDASHARGRSAFSAAARRRAMLDREWQEGIEERCVVPSPFAARLPLRPAC